MNTGLQFSDRGSKVANLRDQLKELDQRIKSRQTRISARESMIRSLQVEQATRADKVRYKEGGYSHPLSARGKAGIRDCEREMASLRFEISKVEEEVEKIELSRTILLGEIRYEENILEAKTLPVRTKQPMRKL